VSLYCGGLINQDQRTGSQKDKHNCNDARNYPMSQGRER
jgi:hypothetical protein